MCERNISWLPPLRAPAGERSATLVYALTGNRTGDLFLCEMMPDQPSYTGEGIILV